MHCGRHNISATEVFWHSGALQIGLLLLLLLWSAAPNCVSKFWAGSNTRPSVMDHRPHLFHKLPLTARFFTGTKLYCFVTGHKLFTYKVWTTWPWLLHSSARPRCLVRRHHCATTTPSEINWLSTHRPHNSNCYIVKLVINDNFFLSSVHMHRQIDRSQMVQHNLFMPLEQRDI